MKNWKSWKSCSTDTWYELVAIFFQIPDFELRSGNIHRFCEGWQDDRMRGWVRTWIATIASLFRLRIWFSKSWQNCEQGTQTHLGLIVVISGIEIYVYMYILKYIEKTLKCIEISWIMNYASQNKGLQKTIWKNAPLGIHYSFSVELWWPTKFGKTDIKIPKKSTGKLKNSVIADRTWFA